MSKLNTVLASAALAASFAAWNASSAYATLTFELLNTSGVGNTATTTAGTSNVTLALWAKISPSSPSGIYDAIGGAISSSISGDAAGVVSFAPVTNVLADTTTTPNLGTLLTGVNLHGVGTQDGLPLNVNATTGLVELGTITVALTAGTTGTVSLNYVAPGTTTSTSTYQDIWAENYTYTTAINPPNVDPNSVTNIKDNGSGASAGSVAVGSAYTISFGPTGTPGLWVGGASAAYGTGSSWDDTNVPANSASTAITFGKNAGAHIVTGVSGVTVNKITFNGTGTHTLQGTGLTISGASAGIVVNGAGNAIQAPVTFASSASITGSSALTLGAVSLSSGNTLTVNNTVTASTLNQGGTGAGSLTVNGSLTLTHSGAAAQSTGIVSILDGLTVGSSGLLNLTNHDVIIRNGGTTELGKVEGWLASAYDGGAWDGTTGITTSEGSAIKGIGYALASELGVSTFDGVSVSANDVLVKYTFAGDNNLDGTVDFGDYNQWASGFGTASGADWFNGDTTYDGVVDFGDYNNWANTFGSSGLAGGAPGTVPEPTSIGLLALGLLGTMGLRARRGGSK